MGFSCLFRSIVLCRAVFRLYSESSLDVPYESGVVEVSRHDVLEGKGYGRGSRDRISRTPAIDQSMELSLLRTRRSRKYEPTLYTTVSVGSEGGSGSHRRLMRVEISGAPMMYRGIDLFEWIE